MKKKISILFILPNLDMGGAERIITTICNHLDRELFSPTLLLFKKEGGYLEFLREDVEVISLDTPSIKASLFPIFSQIRKRKPDIVFSGWGEISAMISPFIPFFRKTKFISRETNVVSEHVTRKEILFFYRFYNHFHKIICQSDDMAEDLMKNFGIKEQKIIKINNPVDFDFIEEKLEISEMPLAFEQGYKNVVAIGNLTHRKGFDQLLQVFTYLKEEKIKLHILGDGLDREKLHQMKQELDLENVLFHGKQKNPYQYLKYADLFILSSRYEGFPNVLLEAGACGVYALANNCPGGIQEIIQLKINGDISCIAHAEQFAGQIKNLLAQQYEKEPIIHSIKSRFSKDKIMDRYEKVFLSLMEK